jgi:hypothetical protein
MQSCLLLPRIRFTFAAVPFENPSQPLASQPSGTAAGEGAGNQNVKGTSIKMIGVCVAASQTKTLPPPPPSIPPFNRMSKHY